MRQRQAAKDGVSKRILAGERARDMQKQQRVTSRGIEREKSQIEERSRCLATALSGHTVGVYQCLSAGQGRSGAPGGILALPT